MIVNKTTKDYYIGSAARTLIDFILDSVIILFISPPFALYGLQASPSTPTFGFSLLRPQSPSLERG